MLEAEQDRQATDHTTEMLRQENQALQAELKMAKESLCHNVLALSECMLKAAEDRHAAEFTNNYLRGQHQCLQAELKTEQERISLPVQVWASRYCDSFPINL